MAHQWPKRPEVQWSSSPAAVRNNQPSPGRDPWTCRRVHTCRDTMINAETASPWAIGPKRTGWDGFWCGDMEHNIGKL